MEKRQIRCFQLFAQVAKGVYNHPVILTIHDGWSNLSLATCVQCGELFVIDWDNPDTKGLDLATLAGLQKCLGCRQYLKDTIRAYPKTVRLADGRLGCYAEAGYIPEEKETIFMEFYELMPRIR